MNNSKCIPFPRVNNTFKINEHQAFWGFWYLQYMRQIQLHYGPNVHRKPEFDTNALDGCDVENLVILQNKTILLTQIIHKMEVICYLFFLSGPDTNDPRTRTGLRPGGWEPLL